MLEFFKKKIEEPSITLEAMATQQPSYNWEEEYVVVSDGLNCVKLTFNQVRYLANALAERPEQMHKIK